MKLYEEVFQMMLDDKNSSLRLDPWVPSQAEAYAKVRTISGVCKYKDHNFLVVHHSGGGVGMGEFPPTANIYILHKF